MRLAAFASLIFVFGVTGCFRPKVQSGGFACSTTDSEPCPSGFFCVKGLCVDHADSDGGGGGGSVGADMSGSTVDMSMPRDMRMPPSDMCLPFGYQCNSDPACCAQCCAGGCALAGNCALF